MPQQPIGSAVEGNAVMQQLKQARQYAGWQDFELAEQSDGLYTTTELQSWETVQESPLVHYARFVAGDLGLRLAITLDGVQLQAPPADPTIQQLTDADYGNEIAPGVFEPGRYDGLTELQASIDRDQASRAEWEDLYVVGELGKALGIEPRHLALADAPSDRVSFALVPSAIRAKNAAPGPAPANTAATKTNASPPVPGTVAPHRPSNASPTRRPSGN